MNRQIKKTFLISVYADGSLKVTERPLPRRGKNGWFASRRPVIIRQAYCPACGAELGLVAL